MLWRTFEVVQKAASGHKFIAKNPLISLRGITQESHKVWAVELMRNHSNFSAKFSLSLHRKPWQSLHCNWSSITELPYVHCSKSSSPYQCVCTEIRCCSRQFFQCEDLHWWSVVWQFCILHWWSTLWRRISTWLAKTRSKEHQANIRKLVSLRIGIKRLASLRIGIIKLVSLRVGISNLASLELVSEAWKLWNWCIRSLEDCNLCIRSLEASN